MEMAAPPQRPREGLAFRARMALRLERFAELLEPLSTLVENYGWELTGEESDLICTAFTCASRQKLSSLRTLAAIEREDVYGENSADVNFFRDLLEAEMECVCQKGIKVLEEYLIPLCTAAEQHALLLKMIGDLSWHQLSLLREPNKEQLREKVVTSYEGGVAMCESLGAAHPLKLAILLNLSAFFHDEMCDRDRALILAQHAIHEATQAIGVLNDESLPVSATTVLELMKENVKTWIMNRVAQGYSSSTDSEPDKWARYRTQPPSPMTSHNVLLFRSEEMAEEEDEMEQLDPYEAKAEVKQEQQQQQLQAEEEEEQIGSPGMTPYSKRPPSPVTRRTVAPAETDEFTSLSEWGYERHEGLPEEEGGGPRSSGGAGLADE